MVDFPLFHRGLEKLLGRPVLTHELGLNVGGLRKEAQLAIERRKKRIGTSKEQKEEALRRSLKMLSDHCERTGKSLKVYFPGSSDRDENGIDQSGEDGWLQ